MVSKRYSEISRYLASLLVVFLLVSLGMTSLTVALGGDTTLAASSNPENRSTEASGRRNVRAFSADVNTNHGDHFSFTDAAEAIQYWPANHGDKFEDAQQNVTFQIDLNPVISSCQFDVATDVVVFPPFLATPG